MTDLTVQPCQATKNCRCEGHNGQERLLHLEVLAGQHREQLAVAQGARLWACHFLTAVNHWRFQCRVADLPKPMLLVVCEVLAYALTERLQWAHSAPGCLIGPVPPATGLPACPPNAGVIWWGRQAYIKPRLRAGISRTIPQQEGG